MSKTYTTDERIVSKYGKNSWKPFGNVTTVPSITTGSYKLNTAIGDPMGWPEGSVIEVYGWQGAGKTLLTYLAIAEAQKLYPDRPCAIIDAEKQFIYQAKWAKSFGVKVEDLYVSACVTAEEAFDKCVSAIIGEAEYDDTEKGKGKITEIINPGNFSIIVVDSVSQLTPLAEFNAGMDENTRSAAQAAAIGKGLRKLVSAMQLVNSKTIVFFINQIRMSPGVLFGSPEARSGGNALKFYSTLICRVTKDAKSVVRDSSGRILSHDVQVKIEKNKAGQLAEDPIRFTLKYDGTGVDNEAELFDIALQNNLIVGRAGWYTFINKNGEPDDTCKFRKDDNGKDLSFLQALNAMPEKKDSIMKLCKEGKIYDTEMTLEDYKDSFNEVKKDIEVAKEVKKDIKNRRKEADKKVVKGKKDKKSKIDVEKKVKKTELEIPVTGEETNE
jgi:recombination protein RecA